MRIAVWQHAHIALLFVFLGYLLAMGTLEQLWELGLGIVIFPLLWAAPNRVVHRLTLPFLAYVFCEPVILIGYGVSDGLVPHELLPVNMLSLVVLYIAAVVWLYQELATLRVQRAVPAQLVTEV